MTKPLSSVLPTGTIVHVAAKHAATGGRLVYPEMHVRLTRPCGPEDRILAGTDFKTGFSVEAYRRSILASLEPCK